MKIVCTKKTTGFTVGKEYTVSQRNAMNYLALNDNNQWQYIAKSSAVEKK